MTAGEEIRAARKEAGLTQREMADELGIPLRTIENWEAGKSKPPDYVKNMVIDKLRGV